MTSDSGARPAARPPQAEGGPPELVTWEHADIAKETAAGLRRHFEKIGGVPREMRLSKAHWHLIVLALERAAGPTQESGTPRYPSEAAIRAAGEILGYETKGWLALLQLALRAAYRVDGVVQREPPADPRLRELAEAAQSYLYSQEMVGSTDDDRRRLRQRLGSLIGPHLVAQTALGVAPGATK